MDKIIIRGAQVHNLKNIDVEIPRNRLVVITGLSGSGKSTLAFDTLYAEGQRRYVESLSAYARQFLEQMERPNVESMEGLSPAIAIDQRSVTRTPRSTVGTVTEIYDYLRLLFARIGEPFCPHCGSPISSQTFQQMTETLQKLPKGTSLSILSPVVRGKKGEYRKEMDELRSEGFVKVRIDGQIRDLSEEIQLDRNKRHEIDVIVDRLVVKEGMEQRVGESLEIASRLSEGIVRVEREGVSPIVFSQKFSCIHCGFSFAEMPPRMFSFNSPHGACPTCSGLGTKPFFDPDLVVPNSALSLKEGAILPWKKRGESFLWPVLEALAKQYRFDLNTPFSRLPKSIQHLLLYGSGGEKVSFRVKRKGRSHLFRQEFEGALRELERRWEEDGDGVEELEEFRNLIPCPDCQGARLKKEVLSIKVGGKSIAEIAHLYIHEALQFLRDLELTPRSQKIAQGILKEIGERLRFMMEVGLDYLTLDRAASTLAGGESQRVRLATQIGSSLVGVLYILDEPSIGLHQRDQLRLLGVLKRLRDLGNTVIVVEHDEETIRSADYIIDMGPGPGEKGGEVVFSGSPEELMGTDRSLTGAYLSGKSFIPLPEHRRPVGERFLVIRDATANNLKNIDVNIPLGVFTCITGVSGSGKSTLIIDTLYCLLAQYLHHAPQRCASVKGIEGLEHLDKVVHVDQMPIGRTPRSNPATYTGLFQPIRELFAQLPDSRMRGFQPGRFSFNVPGGRCESCGGDGLLKVEMHFLPDVYVTCEACHGKRYNRETLDIRYRGKTISDVLGMTVEEADDFFQAIPSIHQKLRTLVDVGLGYLQLGQPATTLSGGEAQRIKLARELSKRETGRTVYILDEPTTGLHFADIQRLLNVINRLTDKGNTVIVIEHNLEVIKSADYIIDLGPEGGEKGGEVVGWGTPEQLAQNPASYTGQFLRKKIGVMPHLNGVRATSVAL
ncbi:MAG TPA: excinuclease ABC subunit UvrA [Thermodesulfobacteriota bacterium]|nr:excinuclease ABC subunit UvrA [Thermodesulfobacteriota bacterium]